MKSLGEISSSLPGKVKFKLYTGNKLRLYPDAALAFVFEHSKLAKSIKPPRPALSKQACRPPFHLLRRGTEARLLRTESVALLNYLFAQAEKRKGEVFSAAESHSLGLPVNFLDCLGQAAEN